MRLLLDQNLSHRLCDNLSDIWTEVVHVRTVGLSAADDAVIWDYAQRHGFTIVSKDSDFSGLSSLFGAPPKVIWLTVGNCSTAVIERCLRDCRDEIETFVADPDTALFVMGPVRGAGAL